MDLLERPAHAVEIARHRDVEAGDLLAGGVEEEDVGLPDGDADHVDAARGADHGVGDLGVGDQHVLDVGRQVDGDRFTDAERDETGGCLARRHLDHRHTGVGADGGYGRRESGARENRERSGAHHCPWRHVPHPPSLVHFGVTTVPTPKRITLTPARPVSAGSSSF